MNVNIKNDIRAWADDAACHPRFGRDSSLFFPEKELPLTHPSVRAAKEICRGCPVQADCLEHAMAHEPFGIWGGMTERQRESFRRAGGMKLLKPSSRRRVNAV